MSTNQEPASELLRLRDVLAWLPRVSRSELENWVELGLIGTVRKRKNGKPYGRRFYRKSDILEFICGTNGHRGVKG